MRARIMGIKCGEEGRDLSVNVLEPWPPFRPDHFRTEGEKAAYDEDYKAYEKVKNEFDLLRLGDINFEYKDD